MPEKIKKMSEFYTIFARKNSFCPHLGGGGNYPLPPVSYAYDTNEAQSVLKISFITMT